MNGKSSNRHNQWDGHKSNKRHNQYADDLLERGLPQNLEAERSILGAILLDNAVCNEAIELMRRDDFFLDAHRRIFDKMVALTERGSIIDLITLGDELRQAAEYEQVGGAIYIASLIDGVPRTDTIEYYARIVKRKAQERRAIQAFESARLTIQEGNFEAAIEEVSEVLSEVTKGLADDGTRGRLITAEELNNLPPLEWLIEGEIPKAGLTVMYGPSGSYKSFLALDYALRIAQDAPVVYVAAEGAAGYGARVRAWCQHHHLTTGRLYFWLDAIPMIEGMAVSKFIAAIKDISPALVVIDTLARCLVGGDENSAKDMGLFVDSCGKIQKVTGAAVMVIHHKGKNNSTERGSSALRGAADAMLEVSSDEGLITLACDKMKDASPFEPRRLRFVECAEFESGVVIPASKVVNSDATLTAKQRSVLMTLNLVYFQDNGAGIKELIEATNIKQATLFRVLSDLKTGAYITQSEKSAPYFITDKGRKAIGAEEREFSSDSQSIKPNVSKEKGKELSELSNNSQPVNESSVIADPLLSLLSHPFRGESSESRENGHSVEVIEGYQIYTHFCDCATELQVVGGQAICQPCKKTFRIVSWSWEEFAERLPVLARSDFFARDGYTVETSCH
ncbi:MAG TPA: AAA family ATPase [Blastocatellia bacterium]|nr:AAA family ATPase [Blastocatellia bacterium]